MVAVERWLEAVAVEDSTSPAGVVGTVVVVVVDREIVVVAAAVEGTIAVVGIELDPLLWGQG